MQMLMIVEDDSALANGLSLALRKDDTQIVICSTLAAARAQLGVCAPALMLLDVNLPDGNGLVFLREIKQRHPALPVILLTANDTETDQVAGFAVGADDYITKPFSLAILRARVETCLRRAQSTAAAPEDTESAHRVELDGYVFDFTRMEFYRACAPSALPELIELSKTEQKLLRIFMENRGITLSRATLVDRIWTDGAEYVDENALSVTVKRLRDKLRADDKIKTVYGVGYVWAVK